MAKKGGKASRNKGHNYEREIAKYYRSFGLTAKRGRVQWEQEEQDSDVVVSQFPHWWIECKSHKTPKILHIWRKMKVPKDKVPVLHLKVTRGPELVIVERGTWSEMVSGFFDEVVS